MRVLRYRNFPLGMVHLTTETSTSPFSFALNGGLETGGGLTLRASSKLRRRSRSDANTGSHTGRGGNVSYGKVFSWEGSVRVGRGVRARGES